MLYSVAPTAEFIPPTRRTNAGWSLGPSVARLRDEFGADYALFTYIRDSYATAGRIAVQVFTALLSRGAYIAPGGAQVGYASLVDLRTGEIVWFNRLARAVGDLRSPEPARETMQVLLLDFPK